MDSSGQRVGGTVTPVDPFQQRLGLATKRDERLDLPACALKEDPAGWPGTVGPPHAKLQVPKQPPGLAKDAGFFSLLSGLFGGRGVRFLWN